MKREVDYDYEFEEDESGWIRVWPDGVTEDGELYVLPNGKLLPPGVYAMRDGSTRIYEPVALTPYMNLVDPSLAEQEAGSDWE